MSRFSLWGAHSGLTRTGAWLRGLWLGGGACLRVHGWSCAVGQVSGTEIERGLCPARALFLGRDGGCRSGRAVCLSLLCYVML